MKYRLITFTNEGYTEKTYGSVPDNTDGSILLTDVYRDYEVGSKGIIRIGSNSSDDIVIEGSPDIRIISDKITSDKPIFVNGKLCTGSILKTGDRILVNDTELTYLHNRLRICSRTATVSLEPAIKEDEHFDDFPVYKRSPRIIKREPTVKIDIKPPKEKEKPKKGELIKRIIPSLVMVCACIAMGLFMGRGMFMLVMVAATGATLVITVVSYFDEKKQRKETEKDRRENYKQYLLGKRKELYRAEKSFLESREYHNLSLSEIAEETKKYSNRIYERNYNDADFLTVSMGRGSQIPSYRIDCSRDEFNISKDPLYQEMLAVYNNFRVTDNVPCVIDLKKAHLGIVGNREYIRSRISDIVTQISFFQSYHDVQFVAFVDEEDRVGFEWMKWLPHMTVGSINVTGLISGENQRDQVLGHINQILKAREISRDEEKKEKRFSPHYVFIVDSPKLLIDHSIMEHLKETGTDLGYSLIFTTQLQSNLPENIKTILTVDAEGEGTLLMNEGMLDGRKLIFDQSDINFEYYARRLRPIIHSKGVTTQIPESVSFFDIYNVDKPEEIPIRELWKKNASHKSLAVPLGVRGKNDIVNLDLHEKAHGPHGLVAGTTGSGKSEILQSYILSLAVNFHPHEVGFLLIDYKGGGMANLFQNLPHLLGTITNLDGSESMRALASIKSELKRRQDVFNKSGVNNINKYTEKFKAKEVTEPLPHLFIISDEFAELKKEQPEFMAELVSTARVGRSLGVHLILATQKPTGIVDDQIWSNSRFKLCLKVQNEADSRELLKTGDAASITQPGRAYLQVGNNEIYELFQSAYSGAAYSDETTSEAVDKRIYVLNELGQGILINEDLSIVDDSSHGSITQLDAVISEIQRVYESEPHFEVAKPWLPPLAEHILNPGLKTSDGSSGISYPVGLVDMPDRQAQEEYIHDFIKSGNIVIFGTSKVGKSTAMVNAALSLAFKNPPEALNMYIVDFGNSALFPLRNLPQVADYISFDDEEKFRKLRNLLIEEISERKRKFARANVTGFEMYNSSAAEKLPAIILMIDNYDVIKEIDYDLENYFTQLTRDGLGVGIYTFVSATRANAIRYAVLNNFGARICNFMSDNTDIIALVGRSDYNLSDIKGRALVNRDTVYLMQEYLPAPCEDPIAYQESINAMVAEVEKMYEGHRAKAIPMLPETLEYYDLLQRKEEGKGVAVGLDAEDVEVSYIDRYAITLVLGSGGTGKTNILKLIYSQIDPSKTFVSDSKNQELHFAADDLGDRYISDENSDIESFIRKLELTASKREAMYQASDKNSSPREFYAGLDAEYILVDDIVWLSDIAEYSLSALTGALERCADCDIRIVATADPSRIPIIASDFIKFFKRTNSGILLGSLDQNIFQIGMIKMDLDEDMAAVYDNGNISKIKVPVAD